jgi:hypothetical protein
MPFLKLLMPLATSPMIEDILPLPPNINKATARNSSQCQILKLPIRLLLSQPTLHPLGVCRTIAERARWGKVATLLVSAPMPLKSGSFLLGWN